MVAASQKEYKLKYEKLRLIRLMIIFAFLTFSEIFSSKLKAESILTPEAFFIEYMLKFVSTDTIAMSIPNIFKLSQS